MGQILDKPRLGFVPNEEDSSEYEDNSLDDGQQRDNEDNKEETRQQVENEELLRQKLKDGTQDDTASAQDEENPQPSTSTEESTSSCASPSSPCPPNNYPTYRKLPGATDFGKDFEKIMCGHYALNLAIDDEVRDFELTSNNLTDGKFDDIGLKITFTNGQFRRFLFQLKHKENKTINLTDLRSESKNNDFSVRKYFKSITEMNLDEDTVPILFTNCSTKIKGRVSLTDEINLQQCKMDFQEYLANTKTSNENAIFEINSKSLKRKFYFFTSQLNVKKTEEQVNAKLKTLLQCDVHGAFNNYMRNWWSGKFILTKHDVLAKISELAFSPYLKTLTDEKCNEKTESLKRAIMNFPLTLVDDCSEDILENIWKREESWIDEEFSKAKNKFGLVGHQQNTILWYLGKIPLVVNVDRSNQEIVKLVMNFLRKDIGNKKIVLIGKVSKTDFEDWKKLESLSDVVKEHHHYSDIMQNFRISFQGRESISLENLVKDNADVANMISTKELLQMSQRDYLLIGNPRQELPELHIPRFIFCMKSTNTTKVVKETEIFKHFKHPLHVICAPPGMGKSTLMKVLFNTCPSDSLAVYISLINYNSFLSTKPDFKTILNRFLGTEATETDLSKRLKQRFFHKQKLFMFLDGLDEVNSQHVRDILEFVEEASSQGANIWLSSRDNLRERICRRLRVVLIDIKELDNDEQTAYITNKLKKSYTNEEIGKITLAIFSSTDLNNSQNLLGIPLQLHIITEMFLRDRRVYENLEKKNLFVLTQMYKRFFEGRIRFAFNKLVDESQELQFGYLRCVHQAYEILALKTCLDHEDYTNLNLALDAEDDLLNELKTEGDKNGIIQNVTQNDAAVFAHQTYAEYFTAAWFKKNPKKIVLLRDAFFSEKYENLRLIFDIILAENNPLHLAIIYKNVEQFENHLDDIDRKDEGGRTVFHLAFSYGQKYPSKSNSDVMYRNQLRAIERESAYYVKIIAKLLQEGKLPDEKDDLFDFDCLDYALQSECLYPIEKILEKELLPFAKLKRPLYRYYDSMPLLYCSAQFGYSNLLSELSKVMKLELRIDKYLLRFAVEGCVGDVCTPPREGNVEAVKILLKNNVRTEDVCILDSASLYKRFDVMDILIENHHECSEGNTILHHLVKNCPGQLSEDIMHAIKKYDIDVNAINDASATALHYAAESADVKIIDMLMENGANFQILDYSRRSILHRASPYDRPDVIKFLLDKGLPVNSQDANGVSPLHLASEKGRTENVKILLEGGADPKLTDHKQSNTLHYASDSENDHSDTIKLLLRDGPDINASNSGGFTPIHLAYKKGNFKTVDFLLECGARNGINDKFENGETLLHLVFKYGTSKVAIELLKRGANANIVDNDKKYALHYYLRGYYQGDVVIFAMINHGFNLNFRDDTGRTLLHIACLHGEIRIVRTLVEKGVNINVPDDKKITPVQMVFKSLDEIKKYISKILIYEYNNNFQHIHESNELIFGCNSCHIKVARDLDKETTNTNFVELLKQKLIMLVKSNERIDLFLKHAPITKSQNKGADAISRFIIFEMINYLIEKGSKIDIMDDHNQTTPKSLLENERQYPEIVNLLREHDFPKPPVAENVAKKFFPW